MRRLARRAAGALAALAMLLVLALAGFRAAAARRETVARVEGAPRTGRFVHAADVELFVQEEGQVNGEPVVLVDAALGLQAGPTTSPAALRALLGVGPLRDAIVAATLTNPMLTSRLLSSLVSERAAITAERVTMFQRPFVLTGTTSRFGEWVVPFATTSESSLATDRARYRALRIPTLVLWGSSDAVTPVAQNRDIATLIPGARRAELPRAGHIPAIEDPAGFDAALLEFLAASSTD